MTNPTDYRRIWEEAYRQAYASGRKHWRPELATPPALVEFLCSSWAPAPGSRVLEAGCGDGLNACFLGQRGYRVTGVDIVPAAIERARQVAAEQAANVEFLCLDLVRQPLPQAGDYDLWVDIKTLHVLWEEADRRAYLATAFGALKPGGVLFLNCALALCEVREHFPDVWSALDEATRRQAQTIDRDLPPDRRAGIRCETLDRYAQELTSAGFVVRTARREASVKSGWGAILLAQKPDATVLERVSQAAASARSPRGTTHLATDEIQTEFREVGGLQDGDLMLQVHSQDPADPVRGWCPAYKFHLINAPTGQVMGHIDLRLGDSEFLRRFAGQIAYGVHPPFRGHHYAARALRLLFPLACAHGFTALWITCNPDNLASRRTCERAGATLVEIADLPTDCDMYVEGERQKCSYRIDL